ncbi:MAG: DUF835 domain-containing protein [Thermoplasmata archaeon]
MDESQGFRDGSRQQIPNTPNLIAQKEAIAEPLKAIEGFVVREDTGGRENMEVFCHSDLYLVETNDLEKAHNFIRKVIGLLDKSGESYAVSIFARHLPVVKKITYNPSNYKNLTLNVYEVSTMSGKNRVAPASAGFIKHTVASTSLNRKPVVVIDCIDTMALYLTTQQLNSFLEELRDLITATEGLGFIIIDPSIYDEKELTQMRRFKSVIKI